MIRASGSHIETLDASAWDSNWMLVNLSCFAVRIFRLNKSLLLLLSLSFSLWLLLAARASAAARGVSISLLACAETRVLALCSPEPELGFCFRVGICGGFEQKNATTGGLHCPKNMLSSPFRIVFSVFSCVCRISHRFLQCFGHLSTFCTCRLRLAFVFQLCAGVFRGGVMTSMRLRLVFSFSFVDHLLLLCCGAVQWWGGGGVRG